MKFRVIKNKSGRSTVLYKCPKCHVELESDLNEAGMDGACPDCHTTFILPGVEEKKAAGQIKSKQMSLTALSDIVKTSEPDPLDKLEQKKSQPKPDPTTPLLGLLNATVAPKTNKPKRPPTPDPVAHLASTLRTDPVPPSTPAASAPAGATRECPYCGEIINAKATKCRFCREMLVDDAPADGSGLIDIPQPRAPKPIAPPAPKPPPILPPVADAYFIANGGTPFGPLTRSQILELATKGKLNAYTLAWRDGMPQWLRISKIPELASMFASIPPPLPDGQ